MKVGWSPQLPDLNEKRSQSKFYHTLYNIYYQTDKKESLTLFCKLNVGTMVLQFIILTTFNRKTSFKNNNNNNKNPNIFETEFSYFYYYQITS